MIGIYKITSPTKKVYIGQSVNIEGRFYYYKKLHCKQQIALYRSFLKHGVENHIFEIVELCDIEFLNDKERHYQEFFNVLKNGLNCKLTKTKDKSGKLSLETIEKMRIAGKKISPENKLKLLNSNLGKKHSKERIEKMSIAKKGKKMPNGFSLKMSVKAKNMSKETRFKIGDFWSKLILNTEDGIYYKGTKNAAIAYGLKRSTLISKLCGDRKNNTNLIYV